METYEKELFNALKEMMDESISILEKYPKDYIPDNSIGDDLKLSIPKTFEQKEKKRKKTTKKD